MSPRTESGVEGQRPARPRSHHLNPDGTPKFVNRLVLETSPYLRQHAHNPVNWMPWCDDAFARATREGRLILLSVGYSTCHWCHVMERESFEDLEVAAVINRDFVAIKVDREERPDVDAIYLAVVQSMTGQGGWPMTLVLTPEREPVFAATYLPPRDGARGAGRGLLSVLGELATAWRDDAAQLTEQARMLTRRIAHHVQASPAGAPPGEAAIAAAVDALDLAFDPVWGGFGEAPKFPRPAALELLLRTYHRTGDERALTLAVKTLEGMAHGGIHDQLGGGFHRYAVDDAWQVPHFEKMLYDNAQLVSVYLSAWQLTGHAELVDVARGILDYVRRDLQHPEGGFYAATDADSAAPTGELEEGRYFTWTPAEVAAAVGERAAGLVCAYYGVNAEGPVDGRSVLTTRWSLTEVAQEVGMPIAEAADVLRRAQTALLEARRRRPAPGLDTKVLTSWNGLMTSAFARAGLTLGEPAYVDTARRAASFVWERLRRDDRLGRTLARDGVRHRGCLDDYAFYTQALLDLYEAAGDPLWLERALALQRELDELFADPHGGYFFTAADAEPLLWRGKPGYDGAEPCGNSVVAMNLLRLGALTGELDWQRRADALFAAFGERLAAGVALPQMLAAVDLRLDEPVAVIVVTPDRNENVALLLAALGRTYLPNRTLVVTAESERARLASLVPAVAERRALEGRATVYLCRGNVCLAPLTGARELAHALQGLAVMWQGSD